MRALFLNQYFPPDPAPTGILFREIADDLIQHGHAADFVDAGEEYRATQGRQGRMKRELSALRRMLAAGKAHPRPDVVISGTSPPCLAVVADRVARKHGVRHFHWVMDLYPEIAVELGEIRRGSMIAKIAECMIRRAYSRCAKVVALDSDMAARLSSHGVDPAIIRPWVFKSIFADVHDEVVPDTNWTWIYSGNLGRAHEWETFLQAQRLLEQRASPVTLVIQGGGPSLSAAKDRAAEMALQRCEFRDYVPESELRVSLLRSSALVVTQRAEVKGLLWPSKLGLVVTLPRPILFIGPKDGAIAAELSRFPHAGIVEPGEAEAAAAWVTAQHDRPPRISDTFDARRHREESLAAWRRLLTS